MFKGILNKNRLAAEHVVGAPIFEVFPDGLVRSALLISPAASRNSARGLDKP